MPVPPPKPVGSFQQRVQTIPGLGSVLTIAAAVPPLWWESLSYWTLVISLFLLCAGAFAYVDPKAREAQTALACGRTIAHWKYREEERAAWASDQRLTGMKQAWRQAGLIFLGSLVVPFLISWGAGSGSATRYLILPVILPLAILWLRRSEVNGEYARSLGQGRETFVSGDGIWADGRLYLFDRMQNLEVVTGDLPYMRFTVNGDDSPEVRVQIPRGYETQAAKLLERFTPTQWPLATTVGTARSSVM